MVFSLELNGSVHIACVTGTTCSRLTGPSKRGKEKVRVVGRDRPESEGKKEGTVSGGEFWERRKSLRKGLSPWTPSRVAGGQNESRRGTLTTAVKDLRREQEVTRNLQKDGIPSDGVAKSLSGILEGENEERSLGSERETDCVLPTCIVIDEVRGSNEAAIQTSSWDGSGESRFEGPVYTRGGTYQGPCCLSGLNWEELPIADLQPVLSLANDGAAFFLKDGTKERWPPFVESVDVAAPTTLVVPPAITEAEVIGAQRLKEVEDKLPFSIKLTEGQSILLMNLLSFGYGATAVVVKLMEGASGSEETASSLALSTQTSVNFFARFTVAALLFAPPMIMRQMAIMKRARKQAEDTPEAQFAGGPGGWMAGLELGVWMFLAYAGQTIGLESSSADHAELIGTVAVILVPFLEALGGHPISRAVWTGTLLACTGMVLLEGGASMANMGVGASGFSIPAGDWWCFVSAVCSAIHVVRSEVLTERFDSLWLVTSQLGLTAALSLGWLAWEFSAHGMPSGGAIALMPTIPWALILFTGPLGTGLCEWLELEVLRFVHASTATLITTTVPLWGGLLAFFLLGETLDSASMVGAVLILLASVQVQLLSKPTHPDAHKIIATPGEPAKDDTMALLLSPTLGTAEALIPDPIPVFVRDERLPASLTVSRRAGWRSHLQDPLPEFAAKTVGAKVGGIESVLPKLGGIESEEDSMGHSKREVGKVSLSSRMRGISTDMSKAWADRIHW